MYGTDVVYPGVYRVYIPGWCIGAYTRVVHIGRYTFSPSPLGVYHRVYLSLLASLGVYHRVYTSYLASLGVYQECIYATLPPWVCTMEVYATLPPWWVKEG